MHCKTPGRRLHSSSSSQRGAAYHKVSGALPHLNNHKVSSIIDLYLAKYDWGLFKYTADVKTFTVILKAFSLSVVNITMAIGRPCRDKRKRWIIEVHPIGCTTQYRRGMKVVRWKRKSIHAHFRASLGSAYCDWKRTLLVSFFHVSPSENVVCSVTWCELIPQDLWAPLLRQIQQAQMEK